MAHILVAYKQFPAPDVGHAGGQSVYRLLDALHRQGHRLTLVARIREEERVHLDTVRPLCDQIYTVPHHRSLPGPRLLAVARSYLALRRTTRRALGKTQPDVLHVEFAQTAVALLGIRHPRTSFRAHDVNWFMMAQRAEQKEGIAKTQSRLLEKLFREIEPRLYRTFDVIAAISEGDRSLLAPVCKPQPVHVLPLSPNLRRRPELEPAVAPGPNVLFVGAMWREYNIQAVQWFLDNVWPSVRAAVPEATFYIVGSKPTPEIQARHDGEHVIVTGFVDELAPWYASATIFVSPMLVAGGLLQKVVDAMGMGVPVVATSASNHGLSATPGEHLCIADDPGAFADTVVGLLQDPQARTELASAGRCFIQSHYDPDVTITKWEATLLNL